MKNEKTSTITARIPTDQKEAIDAACKRNGISKSEYIKGLMTLQNEDASETAKKLRENPSEQSEDGGGLAAIGFTVAGVALMHWLTARMEESNNVDQFTRR